jgi:hypothetical protein
MILLRIETETAKDLRDTLIAILGLDTPVEIHADTETTPEREATVRALREPDPKPKTEKLRGRPRKETTAPVPPLATPVAVPVPPAPATTMFDTPAPAPTPAPVSAPAGGVTYDAMKVALQKVSELRASDNGNEMAGLNRATAIIAKYGCRKVKEVPADAYALVVADCAAAMGA